MGDAITGAIVGDIVGSRFEFNNNRSKDFELFATESHITDDTIMTLAVAEALRLRDKEAVGETMHKIAREFFDYPGAGWGGRFAQWIASNSPQPYNSLGNGSAMRVSAVALTGKTAGEVLDLARQVTEVSHDHPEGIRGAQAVATAIFMALHGNNIGEIRKRMDEDYYKVGFTIDEIRESYRFNETCAGSVPQALAAFYESVGFEDAIRNAVSIGGDSDTIAAITGSIAGAFYGVPAEYIPEIEVRLPARLLGIYRYAREELESGF